MKLSAAILTFSCLVFGNANATYEYEKCAQDNPDKITKIGITSSSKSEVTLNICNPGQIIPGAYYVGDRKFGISLWMQKGAVFEFTRDGKDFHHSSVRIIPSDRGNQVSARSCGNWYLDTEAHNLGGRYYRVSGACLVLTEDAMITYANLWLSKGEPTDSGIGGYLNFTNKEDWDW